MSNSTFICILDLQGKHATWHQKKRLDVSPVQRLWRLFKHEYARATNAILQTKASRILSAHPNIPIPTRHHMTSHHSHPKSLNISHCSVPCWAGRGSSAFMTTIKNPLVYPMKEPIDNPVCVQALATDSSMPKQDTSEKFSKHLLDKFEHKDAHEGEKS
eukprot:749552-Hanusia_phi.AAC.2